MILAFLAEAERTGARLAVACRQIGLSLRCIQRWREPESQDDRRCGPKIQPANALSTQERKNVLATMNSPEYSELSPNQIVPRLADIGRYVASESTMYRILRAEEQLAHRGRAKAPTRHAVTEHVATASNQVWSWDITYLMAAIRGQFYYLYLAEDVWSRKIVGWAVHEKESMESSAEMIREACALSKIDMTGLVLHSDNGGPMKGSTMLATLQRLGVVPSFSRPSVSNDNPFSEALFRTLKYRPEFPAKPFASLDAARAWVEGFVRWYNQEHRHSGIRFVTPAERHDGLDVAILAQRVLVYEKARSERPDRWASATRNWAPVGDVYLNPQERHSTNKEFVS